jgi:hypothetical protein
MCKQSKWYAKTQPILILSAETVGYVDLHVCKTLES